MGVRVSVILGSSIARFWEGRISDGEILTARSGRELKLKAYVFGISIDRTGYLYVYVDVDNNRKCY